MTPTVLIVDDSLTVRMDLADAFRRAGFEPIPCATADAARRAWAAARADAVVLDVLLPDGDGLELLTEIRDADGGDQTPVVVLSSEAEVADRVRGLRRGADEYVGKPYDTGHLVARVQRLVRPGPGAGGAPVLVIDDSATLREQLRELLAGAGYVVRCAATGEEGLRAAAQEPPAAVIVDGQLPGIDGATVIRRLRLDAALRDVPCLLLTSAEGTDTELQALDAGADAFVRKTDDLAVILAKLHAVLRQAPDRTADAGAAASIEGPKRILAVDDSETHLRLVADTLERDGYEVILARSGQEALDLLAVQPVDCILLDLLMPGLSGRETCERIKAAPRLRDVPLIMLTALDDREAMLEGLASGADDYISKSSDMDVLRARVRAQVRRRRLETEHRRVREALLRKDAEATRERAARLLSETRAQLADELERKNRELESFSYSVSHDLRAPLRAIDGFSRIVLEECADALPPRATERLQRVRAAAQRMGELIDDLLQLSRVGRAELVREPLDLSALARAVADELCRRAGRDVDVAVVDGLAVDADPRLMRVVFENLLGNSLKFTARAPEPRIRVEAADANDGPGVVVRDNGAGFDMAYVDKLFRPFQRLHSESDFPGTGIGLSIVHRIVDRHGGRVWAESVVGQGTAVYFTVGAAPGESS